MNKGGRKQTANPSAANTIEAKALGNGRGRQTTALSTTLQPCACAEPCAPNCSRFYLSQDTAPRRTGRDADTPRRGRTATFPRISFGKVVVVGAILAVIVYGNWPQQHVSKRAALGFLTNNIPDRDASDNVEDNRGERYDSRQRAADMPTAPKKKWWQPLPPDFSVAGRDGRGPPWQAWTIEPDPEPSQETGVYQRQQFNSPTYPFCPPERRQCWRPNRYRPY